MQCVVVRFGGAASPGGAGKAPAPRAVGRRGSQPQSHGVSWERGGSHRARGSPSGALPLGGVGLLCFWIPIMEVLEFCSRVKGRGAVCSLPTLPGVWWQRAGDSAGRAVAVLPCLPWDGQCRECAVPIPAVSPASQAAWESPGGVSGAAPSSAFSQGSSRAAFGRGSWAKPRAPNTVNQAVQVGSQPKPERKGKKWVSFLELSLAPAETEGPMILHHFAFSLPPLTQAVPRTGCALPGPARPHRMLEQELLSHEDAVGSPCSHLHCSAGSCSLAAAPQ